MNRESLLCLLRAHEGLKLDAYLCPAGRLTIGYGHTGPDVTEGMKITNEQAEEFLSLDAASAVSQCRVAFLWFGALDDLRQNVIASLVFNMGLSRLREFKKMLAAIEARRFDTAANELMMSKYASQVGRRASELAEMLKIGETLH